MIGILFTILIILTAVLLIFGCFYDNRLHILFPGHITLAIITTYISLNWFKTGQEFLFNYGSFWTIVERGSLEALSSAMGIIGVGCVLLGWTYSERDKVSLGKKQIDMVHYKLGYGYAVSIVIHFASTALCVVMLTCKAREAALWAFFTVLWGCFPQAYICLWIALNRKERENLALKLWKEDGKNKEEKFDAILKMAGYLSDASVRHNRKFCKELGSKIASWLVDCYDEEKPGYGATIENIKFVSVIYREIAQNIPEQEKELVEEDILKNVCTELNVTVSNNESAVVLLCCGYFRFLCAQQSDEMKHRIKKAIYYIQRQEVTFKLFGELMLDFNGGLEWYQFINQRVEAPEYIESANQRDEYICSAFEQLLMSIFEDDGLSVQRNARLAWNQLYPEVN